jgi:hypothetical protein
MQVILGILGYIAAALLVGYFGKTKTLGFWGYFAIGLVLTPFIGLVSIFAEDQIVARRARALAAPQPVQA